MHSDRVRWVLGPPAEVKLVRRIFSLFANTEISIKDLARLLARESKQPSGGMQLPYTCSVH